MAGLSIPAIENLGVTKDGNDSIDLSDNAISSLSNLPILPRLKHLLLASNPIVAITPNLSRSLPGLVSLVLTGTQLKDLQDLEPLTKCKRLEFLSVKDSPASRLTHYRPYLIHHCKKLRFLDFDKIKDKVSLLCTRLVILSLSV